MRGQPVLLICHFARAAAALCRHHLELAALPANVLDQPVRAPSLVRFEVGPLARGVAVVAGFARALEVGLASTARAAVGVHGRGLRRARRHGRFAHVSNVNAAAAAAARQRSATREPTQVLVVLVNDRSGETEVLVNDFGDARTANSNLRLTAQCPPTAERCLRCDDDVVKLQLTRILSDTGLQRGRMNQYVHTINHVYECSVSRIEHLLPSEYGQK